MPETSVALRFEFSQGTGILTVGPQDQIAEPFRAAIEDDQLTGTWCYLVVGVNGIPRVLGAFVSTVGGRLLFSPAGTITASGSSDFSCELNPLNHITLEERNPGSYASHLRGGPDRRHESSYPVHPPTGLLVPWLSLLLPDVTVLRPLPKVLVVTFQRKQSDLPRFASDALQGGVTLVELPEARSGPSFVQFDFWAGMTNGWTLLSARPLAWAYKPEVVANASDGQQEITIRHADIRFSDARGVRVFVSRPAGVLRAARILRPTLFE
ncbi:MAG: hypothetical protein OEY77_12675 [Nitrospira sp.]|nr:hypothetical protein [Nitrospira sp.]